MKNYKYLLTLTLFLGACANEPQTFETYQPKEPILDIEIPSEELPAEEGLSMEAGIYIVQENESLADIAHWFNVPESQIRELNNLEGEPVAGQLLTIFELIPIPIFLTVEEFEAWVDGLGWELNLDLRTPQQQAMAELPENYFISGQRYGFISPSQPNLWLEISSLENLNEEETQLASSRLENRIQILAEELLRISETPITEEEFVTGTTYCIQADLEGCVYPHPLETMMEALMEQWTELTGMEAFG